MNRLPKNILFIGIAETEYPNLSNIPKHLENKDIEIEFIFQPQNSLDILLETNHDIVLIDFAINKHKTLNILQSILKDKPQKCFIILADEKDKDYYDKAMKAGACDFLIKQNLDLKVLEKSVNYSFRHSKMLAELRESQAKYKDLVEHLPAMFYISEIVPPYSQIYASPLFAKFGYNIEDWLNVKNMWESVLHPDDREWVLAETNLAMQKGKATNYEYRIIGKNGEIFWVHDIGHFYHTADGETAYWQGLMSDITERKTAQETLIKKLQYDELTGLKNRRSLVENLEISLARFRENNSQKFAVFLLDIDRFKLINDSLGHLTGDKFLIEVSHRLENIIGESGLVARLSGDEFAILIKDASNPAKIVEIAEHICQSLALPVKLDDYEFSASASVGITIADQSQKNPSDVLRNADVAMYFAKSSGKNCYKYYDEQLYENNLRLVRLENELHYALERNELSLVYQPIICLKTGKTHQVECLLRWHNATYGDISPAEFIPIAEENGLIIPIGKWVLEQACQQLKKWQNSLSGQKDLVVAVNISAKQIVTKHFITFVKDLLINFDLNPQNLCLEITETSLIDNGNYVLEGINALHQLGIRLSTDDFGTGYSSLSYLHQFPFSELKIDSSFIGKIDSDHKSRKIVRTMINLAQSLELTIVAEGVETSEQLEELVKLGCHSAQGFYLAKPMPARGLENILSEGVQSLLQNGFKQQIATLFTPSIDFSEKLPN